jgi:urease subunit alpha
VDHGVKELYGLKKEVAGVTKCRDLTKKDMVRNDATPRTEVDPETFEVKADGELLLCDPVEKVPLAQMYFLF